MKNGKVILGVLAGMATGAFLGILFAPDKGSQTRKKIAAKGNTYVDELGDKVNDLISGLMHKTDGIKEEARQTAKTAESKSKTAEAELAGASNGSHRTRH